MTDFTHDMAVFIGRFQPFHEGHLSVIKTALDHAPTTAVLIGSAYAPRSHRNPFTFTERKEMILDSVRAAGFAPGQVICLPLEDAAYNDERWMTNVRNLVTGALGVGTDKVTLIGHSKDHTSFYLNMFPEWDAINVPCHLNLSATPMRESYFSNIGHMWLKDCDGHKEGDLAKEHRVPTPVKDFLTGFLDSPEYKAIRAEYEFVLGYRAQYSSLPYPPVFVTADACVIQSGHILLVKRKGHPGRGQWALPGGHVEVHQTVEDAMLDELAQETLIGLDRDLIRNSIVHQHIYDEPHRDPRGRYITHGFLVHLKRSHNLPNVQGADDAEVAKWWPLTEVRRDMMFLDHYDILLNLTARI